MSETAPSLVSAREAAAHQMWRAAYTAFAGVDQADLAPADLESYGEAAWWSGKLDEAIGLRERAHGAYSASGDVLGAARLALILSWDYEGRGSFAVSGGWLATAERLLDGLPEAPEHARLLLFHAVDAMYAKGDVDRAIATFDEAYEVARRVGDRDVQMLALSGKGRAVIRAGDSDRGLALMDEAAATAMTGDVRPLTAGMVYCQTISSCNDLGDYRRASEWTDAANKWCDRLDVSGFPGACRIHRAEILRLRGDWPAAEAQAIAACEELSDFNCFITSNGYYEIGEIRRRRGDFAGAEEAYRSADELGRDPQPGRALLHLAEGKIDAAVAEVTGALVDVSDPLIRMKRLPARVEIAVAANDLRAARAALAEIEEIVDAYTLAGRRIDAFEATLSMARGRIRLAEGDADGAVASLQQARAIWQGVGGPFETAQARMLLGIAHQRRGDRHSATVEFEAALAAFERLGARPDADRIAELLGRVETRRTFLFTDIVDSTRLLETLGDAKWKRLLARHDELIRERIHESGGEVVKSTGDGVFAAFETPGAAVDAAIAIQRALADEIVAPDVRIGLHVGDAFRVDAEAADYGGQGVHVAARIGSAAGPGEILASVATLDGIGAAVRASAPRLEQLKGITEPVEVVSVTWR